MNLNWKWATFVPKHVFSSTDLAFLRVKWNCVSHQPICQPKNTDYSRWLEFDGLGEFFVTQKKNEEGDFIEIYERHSQNLLVSGLRGEFEMDKVISMLKESPYQIELSSDELNALYVIFEMQDDF